MIVEATGHVDFGLQVTLEAMKNGKHVVLMNAELDATLGPILQVHAARYGVILSACDGDEPGVQMNLYRWVKGLGLTPRVMGNVKGLQDPYRTPTTQAAFAEKWGQNSVDGHLLRRRIENQLRAVDRRQRDRLQGEVAGYVARSRIQRATSCRSASSTIWMNCAIWAASWITWSERR